MFAPQLVVSHVLLFAGSLVKKLSANCLCYPHSLPPYALKNGSSSRLAVSAIAASILWATVWGCVIPPWLSGRHSLGITFLCVCSVRVRVPAFCFCFLA